MAMSSDKLATLEQGLLSVDLDVQHGDEHKVTSVELDKEDLYKLITSLESANKVHVSTVSQLDIILCD